MSTARQVQLDAANKVFKALFVAELTLGGEGDLVGATAMKTRSKAKVVEYNWLNGFDELREWVGERHIANMAHESFTITNVKYESSMTVDRVDVETDSLGLYGPQLSGMVAGYHKKRRQLIASLLLNGHVAGNNCYDGGEFFDGAHPSDGNGSTQSNYDATTALTSTTFDAAVLNMEQLVDHRGTPMDIQPDTIIVGPTKRATCRNLFQMATIYATDFAGDNPWFNAVKVIVDPYITDNSWYLVDTSKTLRPFILQDADDLELQTLKSIEDEFVIMHDAFFYGTRSRFAVGYGLWQTIYKAGTV